MARLPLNKAALSRRKRDLATYNQFLPSLDLKRKQLIAARGEAKAELARLEEEERTLHARIGADLPMLADESVKVEGLVRVAGLDLDETTVAGVAVPVVGEIRLETRDHGRLVTPHWLDRLAETWREALRLAIEIRVCRARLSRIAEALATVTQRINLFEKVLIPRTEREISRIAIALEEAERAGVIRAKVAKRKTTRARGEP